MVNLSFGKFVFFNLQTWWLHFWFKVLLFSFSFSSLNLYPRQESRQDDNLLRDERLLVQSLHAAAQTPSGVGRVGRGRGGENHDRFGTLCRALGVVPQPGDPLPTGLSTLRTTGHRYDSRIAIVCQLVKRDFILSTNYFTWACIWLVDWLIVALIWLIDHLLDCLIGWSIRRDLCFYSWLDCLIGDWLIIRLPDWLILDWSFRFFEFGWLEKWLALILNLTLF